MSYKLYALGMRLCEVSGPHARRLSCELLSTAEVRPRGSKGGKETPNCAEDVGHPSVLSCSHR